jgi:hypothetical protein
VYALDIILFANKPLELEIANGIVQDSLDKLLSSFHHSPSPDKIQPLGY